MHNLCTAAITARKPDEVKSKACYTKTLLSGTGVKNEQKTKISH